MASMTRYCLLFAILASSLASFSEGYRRHHKSNDNKEFLGPEPKSVISTEGGNVNAWFSDDFERLKSADLAAAVIVIEPKSLSLPKYSDVAGLVYVVEGTARAGLISPLGINTNVRSLKCGDILAVPRGWAYWIWNQEESQTLKLFAVAETSTISHAGYYHPFHLVGGDVDYSGGLLNGFSMESLAMAFDVGVEDIQKLIEAQSQTGFVKVEATEVPELDPTSASPGLLGDFVYNLDESQPDVSVKNGGVLWQLNFLKLPILKKLGLAVTRVHLKPGAILAPQFITNAHRLLYITMGSGRIEMSFPDGKTALDTQVKAGDLILVPPGFPVIQRASDDNELHFISISGTSLPIPAFLAGGNSLFSALPRTVRNVAFNIDEELSKKFDGKRRHEFVIFPSQSHLGTWKSGGQWMQQNVEILAQELEKFMLDSQEAMNSAMTA